MPFFAGRDFDRLLSACTILLRPSALIRCLFGATDFAFEPADAEK
jgi:hypothetical protein